MNWVFLLIVLGAFLTAAWRELVQSASGVSVMEAVSKAMVDSAAGAVELAIGLVGVMALFLGLMKIAEAGGMLRVIARIIRPLMTRLFPDVPPDHPAMGAMILNLSANTLGLGNAATPFGIRAMQELDALNPQKGTATNAMVLFLALNTSTVTLLPSTVIAMRAAAGSSNPASILPSTLFATLCATAAAIVAAKGLQRWFRAPAAADCSLAGAAADPPSAVAAADLPSAVAVTGARPVSSLVEAGAYPLWVSALALGVVVAAVPLTILYGRAFSPWLMPGLMVAFLVFGLARRVPIYETFVEGAKDGFQVAIRIIPYLVAILVAVGMLRASGALDAAAGWLGRWTAPIGLPPEALPMALLRPLSGSGAYAVMASIINDPAIGPDGYVGNLVSTLQGTTETTFYVLAVYFGAVQVRRIRHALAAALIADVAGIAAAVGICRYLFG
ncbi:MAG TPA: nucleoside recognition domain-containing protein [Gammaproteobacteria bacterium]|nr:nucleoside recognition domain-containing protein [Gammaproteobacteria bacterium]